MDLGRAALQGYFADSGKDPPEKSVLDRWLTALEVEKTLKVLDKTLYARSGEGVYRVNKRYSYDAQGDARAEKYEKYSYGYVLLSPRLAPTPHRVAFRSEGTCYDTLFIGFCIDTLGKLKQITVSPLKHEAGEIKAGKITGWQFGVETNDHKTQTPHQYDLAEQLSVVGDMFGGSFAGALYHDIDRKVFTFDFNAWGYPTPSSYPNAYATVKDKFHETLLMSVRELQKYYGER